MTASAGNRPRRALIIVENLSCPFDRRVWLEATTLARNGYVVSIICPKGAGYDRSFEVIDGIHIYRHWLPKEGAGALGYWLEYGVALACEMWLAIRIAFTRGFDVIHACNPPDLIFLVGWLFKPFGKRFVFDHHDVNPELYVAKFGRKDLFYRLILLAEWLTFRSADISIATNESYRRVAIERGGMSPDRVFVVRSGPDLGRVRIRPPAPSWRNGRRYLVGYVGVMGKQEGLDLLLRSISHIVTRRGRTDIQFVLVGGGTELEALRLLCKDLELEEFVTFPGRLPDEALFDVLSTADVCVNPDPVNAMNDMSTMNKIMEYMALGRPIVQFELTEGRYSAAGSSLYALPNDIEDFAHKVLQLIDAADLRRTMGAAGQRRIREELSWEHEAPRLLDAYEAVFRSRNG
jgi:glycosyltransferase involved in cell wall biosynthesis